RGEFVAGPLVFGEHLMPLCPTGGKGSEFAFGAQKSAFGPAVFIQPVGIYQARGVIVRSGCNRCQERGLIIHALCASPRCWVAGDCGSLRVDSYFVTACRNSFAARSGMTVLINTPVLHSNPAGRAVRGTISMCQ